MTPERTPAFRPALLALLVSTVVTCKHPPPELTIAAATSLREVVPALIEAYVAAHPGAQVTATYGASGGLKAQVAAGAPVDAVLFAGPRSLDELVADGKVDGPSCRTLASNELVLVGKPGGPRLTFESLDALPEGERLAVGDPRTVPAGEYAKDYLRALGEWDVLQPHLVTGANVAAVLVYARRGEATAAIVYRTELRSVSDLVVLDVAHGPLAPHPKVVGGVVHGGRAEGGAFLDFVASPEGEKVLTAWGFGPP